MLEPKNKYSSQIKKKNWNRNIEPQKESIPQYTVHITHVFCIWFTSLDHNYYNLEYIGHRLDLVGCAFSWKPTWTCCWLFRGGNNRTNRTHPSFCSTPLRVAYPRSGSRSSSSTHWSRTWCNSNDRWILLCSIYRTVREC